MAEDELNAYSAYCEKLATPEFYFSHVDDAQPESDTPNPPNIIPIKITTNTVQNTIWNGVEKNKKEHKDVLKRLGKDGLNVGINVIFIPIWIAVINAINPSIMGSGFLKRYLYNIAKQLDAKTKLWFIEHSDLYIDQLLDASNMERANKVHEATGIKFDSLGFPVFESLFDAQLNPSEFELSDYMHKKIVGQKLFDAIQNDLTLIEKLKLTKEEIKLLPKGYVPDGYVWHHHQIPGKMQLVDFDLHDKTKLHTGGRKIWGGENR